MDEQTRRDVDEACLQLLGWQPDEWWPETQQWRGFPPGGHILMFCSPSRDERFVVPLAEALRARGYSVCLFAIRGQWEVTVCHQETWERAMVDAPTAPEALATAAARAVGTETEE